MQFFGEKNIELTHLYIYIFHKPFLAPSIKLLPKNDELDKEIFFKYPEYQHDMIVETTAAAENYRSFFTVYEMRRKKELVPSGLSCLVFLKSATS